MRKGIDLSTRCADELAEAARGLRHAGAIFHAIIHYAIAGDADKCDLISLCEAGVELTGLHGERAEICSDEVRHA